jgi:hypothetical protein
MSEKTRRMTLVSLNWAAGRMSMRPWSRMKSVKTDRGGQVLHEKGGAAIDYASVAIVGAHPVGRIGGAAGFQADGVGGGFVQGLPVESVVVAAMAEVKETSGGGEEVKGRFGVAAGGLEDAAALAGPLLGFLEVKEQGKPDGEVVVAQTAGTILQVGFQMENRVAKLGVARSGDFAELLGDGIPLAEDQAGQDGLMELLVELEIAGEEAAVKGGESEFEVVRIESAGFLDGAGTGAGAQADVPHALNDGTDGLLGELFGFFVGKGKEDVNVGVGEEILAPVTAEGE